ERGEGDVVQLGDEAREPEAGGVVRRGPFQRRVEPRRGTGGGQGGDRVEPQRTRTPCEGASHGPGHRQRAGGRLQEREVEGIQREVHGLEGGGRRAADDDRDRSPHVRAARGGGQLR